jgi:hypothetical protein
VAAGRATTAVNAFSSNAFSPNAFSPAGWRFATCAAFNQPHHALRSLLAPYWQQPPWRSSAAAATTGGLRCGLQQLLSVPVHHCPDAWALLIVCAPASSCNERHGATREVAGAGLLDFFVLTGISLCNVCSCHEIFRGVSARRGSPGCGAALQR